ncbi:MAG TPA: AAA family ATPase, partial [bacterium]|nr:AAA family ATPase [bacterium]
MSLFEIDKSGFEQHTARVPLAERIRPRTLSMVIGQEHLLGHGKALRTQIEQGNVVSMIFWGPPGTGKTTLARVIAAETRSKFVSLSAVEAGVADVRRV